MEFKAGRVKILDYFCKIESNSDKCQATTHEARINAIRATCKSCHKVISGTRKVNSNFITHLRKCHPDLHREFQGRLGRQSLVGGSKTDNPYGYAMVSIASLDEPDSAIIGSIPSPEGGVGDLSSNQDCFFRGTNAMSNSSSHHLPTSTVRDHTSTFDALDIVMPSATVKTESEENEKVWAGPSNLFRSTNESAFSGPQQHSQTEALLNFIVGDLLPMEVVESPRLAEFLHRVNPEYRLPSQDEVQRLCDFKISLRKAQLTDQLKSVPSLCLSQEVWKHSDVKLLYLTLTCHYIEGWCYKHVLLSGSTVSADVLQDRNKMAELQQAVLSQYSLESKVLVIVNNLGNNFPLPGFLSPSGVAESLPVSVSLGQSGYAFLLGKAVTQSITDCGENLLEAISQAAALAESAGIKPGHSIPQTKQESWVEHLSLIDLVLQTPREKFLADSPDRLLQSDQILLLTNMVEVLRPFQEVAKRVQNTRSISCSLAFASIRLLKAALLDLKEAYSECRLVDELAKNYQMVTADIDDNNKANAYTIATILDPRFKLQWCDNANQNDLKKSMIQLAKGERLSEGGASDESIKPESIQSGFFTRILKQPPESVQAGTIASEVLRYLDEPLMMEDCDIMSYWQANDTNFPHLSGLAQKYLAIPTSYADVEGFYHLKGETMSISSTSVKGDSFLKAVQLRCSLA